MASPLSKPSQLWVTEGPLHRKLSSSEYLPVPRHASGSQQSSPLLEGPTLSNNSNASHKSTRADLTDRLPAALNSDNRGYCSIGDAVDWDRPSHINSTNQGKLLFCIIDRYAANVYQGALIVITQQLALRSNLLRRQTLTALHDKSVAWGGLGASILSLWRQVSVPAAVHGTLCVVLYLVSISILHVSSSSLINVETYNTNVPTTVRTLLGLPNMTAVETVYDEESWGNAGAVASALGQLPTMYNHGLVNSTVYDIVLETTGVGNTTVNATTFSAKCYSAEQVYNSLSEDAPITIEWGGVNASFFAFPLYEGALWFVESQLQDVQGGLLTFLSSPPIPDSNGALGTTFPVVGTIYGVVEVITPGVQLFWLFSRQPGIKESLYEVSEPSEDQLRKAGLVDVQATSIDDGAMMDPEPRSF
ncbi:hypothetical protein PAXINDRAFT_154045 [Paxillus involutus ATCC 200175]|nr:hypothetical protein PAXINDRAFT_154045 [Paxillus involutus ATCC 200175]